jgi:TPR repeat protein
MFPTRLNSNFPPLRLVLSIPGEAGAHYDLGLMCIRGQGAPRDDVEAVRWFHSSAEQGYATAQFALACMFHAGDGVKKDLAEALTWYRKSAGQAHDRA